MKTGIIDATQSFAQEEKPVEKKEEIKPIEIGDIEVAQKEEQ